LGEVGTAQALVAVSGDEAAAAVSRAGALNTLLGMEISGEGTPSDRLDARAAADLVDAVGAWLGTAERRIAASMVVLGYSARLVGPSVAVLVRDGILLDLRPSRVRYSYTPRRGFRLCWTAPAGYRGEPEALREQWFRDVVTGHLGLLVAAVRAVEPVATRLLWGNVASGVVGALRAVAAAGWVPAERCLHTGLSIVDAGPLRDSGRLSANLAFVRRTCCLYYRLDGGGMCGDCPLPARTGAA
jgi:ferric iron reductase protein FhuF